VRFYADLHIHSKYSRATSRDLDLEHLFLWAGRKGIALVATGDFTHPAWRAELKEKLVPAEPGLFRLSAAIEHDIAKKLPAACDSAARFVLSVEISTIYKRGDRTRKIHHLLYAPDFEAADRISARLARIGNIASDGRPILGLDSRDLLEITLEASPNAYLVPAHIWTPWFAALGSQSGFDSIVECYRDLADHIFAVETGLSSDPPMNWRLSLLDRYRLVSNSDAHSPAKLGREATTFDTDLDYFAVRRALETGDGYVGTVELFPEEGKYHLDGHRKCGVRLTPRETRALGNRCPACGQPTTVGVLHRVEVLADRSEAEATPPATAGDVSNLVSLPEVLSELVASGPSSKAVERRYDRLLSTLGSELPILESVPIEDIAHGSSALLAEAISRLRAGNVIREAGYDGEYGTIRLFDQTELRGLTAGGSLFDARATPKTPGGPASSSKVTGASEEHVQPSLQMVEEPTRTLAAIGILAPLDEDQRRAAETVEGPLVIVAAPGSGKTRTLTHRIAYLVAERHIPASACLAITFTRRAAAEMKERLAHLLSARWAEVAVHTFHSLGLAILREQAAVVGLHRDFRVATDAERAALLTDRLTLSPERAGRVLRAISKMKRTHDTSRADVRVAGSRSRQRNPSGLGALVTEAFDLYQRELAVRNWVDFDDLVGLAVQVVATNPEVAMFYRNRFRSISVDEFQDVDEQQYRMLTLLARPGGNLCVIGDPHQAIYGFRGADASCFDRFAQDYPEAATVRLTRNYRSTGTIVTASSQVIMRSVQPSEAEMRPLADIVRAMHERITIHSAPTERAEAEFVVQAIERMIGGHSFFSIDSGRATGASQGTVGFADFAVLYRTDAQSEALCEAFARSGLPFKKHSHDPLTAQPVVQALLQEWERGLAGGPNDRHLAAQLRAAAECLAGRGAVSDIASMDTALQRLMALAETCAGDRARFTDAVALATEADFWDPRAERVSLLTLHAAKGLEFTIVFIVGLEDRLLPLYWNELDESTAAEERRLFYVGMTRAKDRLILSRAAQRMWRGQVRTMSASPFLSDIEQELVKQQRTDAGRRKPEDRQLRLL
jgi:DNA helicase II / ATP-dependent DNA helicase PcrA